MDTLPERLYASPSVPFLLPANFNRHPNRPSPSLSLASGEDTCENSDCNSPMLKYISDILLEEELEAKPCMLQNCLALQATEKSFYDLLNPKYRPMLNQGIENSDDESTQSCQSCITPVTPRRSPFHDQSSLVECSSSNVLVSHSLLQMKRNGIVGVREAIRKAVCDSQDDICCSTNGSKGTKNHQRDDGNDNNPSYNGRSSKQSSASVEESVPHEMFEKLFLCQGENHESEFCSPREFRKPEESGKLWFKRQPRGSQKPNNELVDVCTLLNQCAQAVASYDQRSVSALLKQIRQHSSPYGHATQRLAHYFANALEARLAGATTPSCSPLANTQTSTADILRAHRLYVRASPMKKMSNFVANVTIMELAKDAMSLHIIDFGISYGFQWPCLIQHISERPGGPPKIHMTAIELPQPGFRPTERVEETGKRLARYCAKFNVPFEYNVIAQKWETIKVEDLNIKRNNGIIVVNCMHRLRHIPDETVIINSPRDKVLNLIKKINPDLFVHGIINGTYSPPFFVTRFKEALFHYGALFDMFDAIMPRDDQCRQMFEREMYGRDIMNVVACEGLERVERPETYRQWNARNVRAGLRQVALDQHCMMKVKNMSKMAGYHKDFRIDEDGDWMLQGWKGRIIMALSFWKPA